jgi:hypothetical protein
MRRAVLFGFTLGLGMLAFSVAPDLRRYFKITIM